MTDLLSSLLFILFTLSSLSWLNIFKKSSFTMSSFLKRAKYCGVGLLHPSTDSFFICYVLCAVKWQYSFFKFKWHMRHLILLEKNKKLNIAIIEQTITCFGVTPFTNFALIKGYPWTSYRSIQLSSIQPDTGHWWLGPLQTFWINKGEHKMN